MAKRNQKGASISELQALQSLVVKALAQDIEQGLSTGGVNQAAIRNALQFLRDNNVVAVDDTLDEVARLKSVLPVISLDEVHRTVNSYS